ncbi:oleosin 1 [Abrus precatorius]|uniref:Oleosin 1 n=1 Tax=Abrus precatorius TaxID=3816 RepID=A0A8B8JSZ4_ABRPR|nr:oleosin 1 [Abrus precatorius]
MLTPHLTPVPITHSLSFHAFPSSSLSFPFSLSHKPHILMADANPISPQTHRSTRTTPNAISATFLRTLQDHTPNSTQLAGILTLIVTASVLLLLTGLTVAGAVLALIFFLPLIIVSSPIWVPAATFLFVLAAGFFSVCGFGVALVAALSWIYRYFRGLHPPGSDRVDYARTRIYDTASHVKDYAREYGGYLQSKVKDAAPGA